MIMASPWSPDPGEALDGDRSTGETQDFGLPVPQPRCAISITK
jgi:hypothetical protein